MSAPSRKRDALITSREAGQRPDTGAGGGDTEQGSALKGGFVTQGVPEMLAARVIT
ncbi:MAG: hypothetical protein JO249_13415 [Acidobacteria bacterium]|nr:hypothetical protein [Acidobacteriota bacterium]MBV9481734.1 hypothetical protein [Acidobacteriota bacterium]